MMIQDRPKIMSMLLLTGASSFLWRVTAFRSEYGPLSGGVEDYYRPDDFYEASAPGIEEEPVQLHSRRIRIVVDEPGHAADVVIGGPGSILEIGDEERDSLMRDAPMTMISEEQRERKGGPSGTRLEVAAAAEQRLERRDGTGDVEKSRPAPAPAVFTASSDAGELPILPSAAATTQIDDRLTAQDRAKGPESDMEPASPTTESFRKALLGIELPPKMQLTAGVKRLPKPVYFFFALPLKALLRPWKISSPTPVLIRGSASLATSGEGVLWGKEARWRGLVGIGREVGR